MKNRLNEILYSQGRRKTWLADQAHVNKNTISRIINGQEPKLKTAYRIAKVLGVTVYDIWPPD